MAALVFWRTPCGGVDDAEKDAYWIEVSQRARGSADDWVVLDGRIPLLDKSDNFTTMYHDADGVAPGEEGEREYRVRFLNRVGGEIPGTTPISPIYGVEPEGITPLDVRKMCQGLDIGETTDDWIHDRIVGARFWLESMIRKKMVPTTKHEEQDGTGAPCVHLMERPLISVERFYLEVAQVGFQMEIPLDWLRIDNEISYVTVIFPAHAQAMLMGTGMPFPYSQGLATFAPIRHLIRVDYTHGLSPVPPNLREAWLKQSAIEVLQVVGDAKGGGIASKAMDGVSVSYTASATTHLYSARIKWYQDDIARILARLDEVFYTVGKLRWPG